MISKILLKKVASYGLNPAVLETDKRINLVYGINGSGKTTISRFLANRADLKFSDCSLEGVSDDKILVYDHDFVETNFYEKDEINGIFTLSSTNKDAEEKIKNATEEIGKIDLQLEDQQGKIGLKIDIRKEKEKLRNLRIESELKIWEIKDSYYGGDRILEFCLDSFNKNNKSDFFDKFLTVKKPDIKPQRTIEQLKEEALKIQGDGAKTYNENDIQKISFDFSSIESDPILSEVIVGNENSTVAALINQLENSDWVKLGLQYLPVIEHESGAKQENAKCPFCQEETISTEFYLQIKNYFNDAYEKKLEDVKKLEDQYWRAWSSIPKEEVYLENPFIKVKEKEFKLLYKNLDGKLSRNWLSIKDKREKSPTKTLALDPVRLEIDALNSFFEQIIEEIRTHNKKVKNKDKHKKEITEAFWEIMRWEYEQTIIFFTTQKQSLDEKIRILEMKISQLESSKQDQEKIIESTQKKIINIDEAVRNINLGLKDLGLDGFEIEKIDDRFYKIKRGVNDKGQFKTLSEGEKTIISFLYFLELCKGKESESEIITKKIVVIDDPISSLSHFYIFNMSQLIKHVFIENVAFQQVFILTHSLYFFHELVRYIPRVKKKREDLKLFRVEKNKSGSSIREMSEDEIQNDYQAYWQIIKKHDEKASNALLANCMRNILEHFFGFVEKEKFDEAITKIDSKKYQAFIRYVNRESHSDFINISDFKEVDPKIFKEAFKEVFSQSGYENHYDKMMNFNHKVSL